MAVRMKDIAEDLGVSIVTVSKALRNHPDIAAATRERVLQRVKELNYRPNLMARSLVTGRSSLVGLIVPDLVHPFFAEIARSLSLALRRQNYFLIVCASDGDPEIERQVIEQLLAHRLDALVVASSQDRPDALREVAAQGPPLILLDRYFPGFANSFVGADDLKIGQLAAEHLLATGRRRIAHIRGPRNSVGDSRAQGFRETLAANGAGLPDMYVVAPEMVDTDGRATGHAAMRRLLALQPPPDALFCFNDNIALGAMSAALESGLRIPDDIAVVGCGNYHFDDSLHVTLTSIDQSSQEIGRRIAKLILGALSAGAPAKPKRIILQPRLVERASSRLSGPRP
ncbi:transcriptional regulator, LacI family [Granulicella rosea]|uniref:Transcriptional regulator, LacI family n=1 Tax=Granulicella rosea TaxID=474952 RepID=A0A239M4R2_9BACT|nr:LacI family DNA-binding transcriptional regulator [Granulicella rosea]SNT37073.1 transcriptional regulator, LacI family [Granulicella rosea]